MEGKKQNFSSRWPFKMSMTVAKLKRKKETLFSRGMKTWKIHSKSSPTAYHWTLWM